MVPARERLQPWRALKRGLVLLITKTRPLRRMMRQSLCRFFNVFRELATRIGSPRCHEERVSYSGRGAVSTTLNGPADQPVFTSGLSSSSTSVSSRKDNRSVFFSRS